MATRTQSRPSNRASSSKSSSSSPRPFGQLRPEQQQLEPRSAFSWGEGAGPVIAAAIGGAAIGFAANYGRKSLMQGMEAAAGDWDEILANEHDMALAIFDKMLATDQTQSFKRKMLFMKLTHALDKHAHRKRWSSTRRSAKPTRDRRRPARGEHGQIETFLYELERMGAEAPNWLEKVREFRQLSRACPYGGRRSLPAVQAEHERGAERQDYRMVNRDGFWMA